LRVLRQFEKLQADIQVRLVSCLVTLDCSSVPRATCSTLLEERRVDEFVEGIDVDGVNARIEATSP
jgi:hypothetical protein